MGRSGQEEGEESGHEGLAPSPTAHPGQAEKAVGEENRQDCAVARPTELEALPSPEPAALGRLVFSSGKAGPRTAAHGRLPAESASLPVRKSFIKNDTFPAPSLRPQPSHCP